jgi:pimeloyl-ACP methyl ester carboxylesterase
MRDLAGHYVYALERAFTGPVAVAGGHLYAALLWLSGPRLAPADPADMLAVIEAEDGFDAAPQLHRIIAPTLAVAGDRDRNYTPELFRETADRIPGARLRLYPRQGPRQHRQAALPARGR